MITLGTGLPGNGKTLFALWYIKKKAEAEGREVYYHNIRDLSLPWTLFDPEKWMDLPHGSIIVIDECQDVFPKKPNGAKLPDFYTELAKHRHKGFDIYLITQHPSLVDNFVRQLVGQHFHSVRKFGLARATIYEWSSANPLPQNPSSQKSAIPLKWKYPTEVYSYYKSAEVHTVKRAIPAKIILAALFVVGMIGAAYYFLDSFQNRGKGSVKAAPGPVVQSGQGQVPVASVAADGKRFDPLADAEKFVAMNTPRVEGLRHTAPKYDQLTVPTSVPVPAMCVQIGSVQSRREITCRCYSQQATRLDVPFNMCLEFARYGYFREFNPDRDRQETARTEKTVQALSSVPDSGPMVLTIPDLVSSSRLASTAAPVSASPRVREERSADVPGPGGVYVR